MSAELTEISPAPLYSNLQRVWPQRAKRLFDVVAAAGLLLFIAPVMLLIACRIKLSDPGPVFFAHMRVGRHGELFPCYKFRTMATNSAELLAELLANDPEARAEWERDRKLRNDPRVTRIGRLLRKTSLDELPQLFNVLKGQMSLVGPRPVVPDELALYGHAKMYYLQVRPGLTGLWQVSGRNDTSYDQRVALDIEYVRDWNFYHDIIILTKTFTVLVGRNGAY